MATENTAETFRSEPPATFNLVREGTEKVIAKACGGCGRVYLPNDSFPPRCCYRECEDCDTPMDPKRGWTVCDPCREARRAARETENLAKAMRIAEADYTGPVYYDGAWNDGHLRDVDEFRDWWETEHEEGAALPADVWACTAQKIRLPDASEIVEEATQDKYENAYDDVIGGDVEALQAAIDAFNAGITAESWEVDYSRLVILSPPVPSGVVSDL